MTPRHRGGDIGAATGSPGDAVKAAGTSPARVVAAVAAAQVTAGLGLYAVLAHLVVHLRHDLGLLASVVGVVLTLRSAVQYLLHLPVGVAIDRLGAHRAAGLACGVRAAGFALLAVATNPPALTLAATLIAVGGSVYIPAGKAILAGLPEDWARRGFAWYVITASLSAVAGPLFGLALLGSTVLTGRHGGLGFAGIAWSAAALWLVAGSLLGSLTIPTGARSRPVPRRLPAAVRDRGMIRLALVVSPAALLVTQAAVVVPLIVLNSRLTTGFLAGAAATAALAQLPRWRATAIRYGVVTGFAGLGTGYLALVPAALRMPGPVPVALVLLGGGISGLAQGALQPAVFHRIRALAPAAATGTYFGVESFVTGVVALVGGLAVGYAFDAGRAGAVTAVLGLVACAWGAAMAGASATASTVRTVEQHGGPDVPPRTDRRGIASRLGSR